MMTEKTSGHDCKPVAESGWTIRRAERRDIGGLMALLYQVGGVHHDLRPDLFKGGTTKYDEEELATVVADDSKPVFVCDEGGRIVGHAFCQVIQVQGHRLLEDMKTLYVDDICVDEAARGHHVGRALYNYVREYARTTGCHNITLNVWEGNDAALAFYRSMGMQVQKTGMEEVL